MADLAEISLQRWAERRYGPDAPHPVTLRRWAHDGFIYPAPRKQGRAYFVQEDAIYLKPGETPPPGLVPVKSGPKGKLVTKLTSRPA